VMKSDKLMKDRSDFLKAIFFWVSEGVWSWVLDLLVWKKRERKGNWDLLICNCWLVDEGVKVGKKEFFCSKWLCS
jgi:hypothetical protein